MDHGAGAELWLFFAGVLVAAKLGGELAVRLKQPAVLGELVAGVVLGNLALAGVPEVRELADTPEIVFLAEVGVVLMLFEVGLESTVGEMRRVGAAALAVAVVGVVAPMVLGYATSFAFAPDGPATLHLFVGATLCATSVGITARVLKDLGALERPETRIILGAAVIDDILGLIVLAVVSAVAVLGSVPPTLDLLGIVALAVGFLVGALVLGRYVMPTVFRAAARLRTEGVLGALAIAACFAFAGAAHAVGLAAIVGAFAAGLILDEVHIQPFGQNGKHDLAEMVRPIVAVLSPVFFVRTGIAVDVSAVEPSGLALGGALVIVAVAGKLVAGVAAGRGVDRLAIGIGMVPRGEVGLIFASAGAGIVVDGAPLFGPTTYMALVLMVAVTTLVTPPWLGRRLRSAGASKS